MIQNDGKIPSHLQTKKFAQRLIPKKWGDDGPNITATSLPDDYVHYSQPRILTVREWARLQMFPDWYEFYGKKTTGGSRRAGNPRENKEMQYSGSTKIEVSTTPARPKCCFRERWLDKNRGTHDFGESLVWTPF